MTLGVTGVVWLPRTAAVNSTRLIAGAGSAPLLAASGAWGALAAQLTDVGATLARVGANLAAAWESDSATATQINVAAFASWAHESVALATDTAAKASAQAAAYAAAVAVMPSLAEIAAVKTAKAAAYTTGGAVNGTAEAAEAVDRALDVRAALVMEAYEAASSVLAVPVGGTPPPTVVAGIGPTGASTVTRSIRPASGLPATQVYRDGAHDVETRPDESTSAGPHGRDPVRTVAASVESWSQGANPMSTASQIAQSTTSQIAQSTASQIGQSAASTVWSAGQLPAGHGPSTYVGSVIGVGGQEGARAPATRAAGFASHGSAVLGPPVAGPGVGPASGFGSTPPTDASATAGVGQHGATAGTGAAVRPIGTPGQSETEDRDIRSRQYDDRIVRFDGATAVVPSVIGGEHAP